MEDERRPKRVRGRLKGRESEARRIKGIEYEHNEAEGESYDARELKTSGGCATTWRKERVARIKGFSPGRQRRSEEPG